MNATALCHSNARLHFTVDYNLYALRNAHMLYNFHVKNRAVSVANGYR